MESLRAGVAQEHRLTPKGLPAGEWLGRSQPGKKSTPLDGVEVYGLPMHVAADLDHFIGELYN